ncbi:SRPBCC family protein [Sandaracinobacteroides hominis]|uniref:SRPBCC family protein n=1 Tax=Sandaracinobacteroides hominis TaxID=2780086 RepID=UPI0018F7A724|nr:SRPBCC domain-containing protein [Sandaracinobacteroides hominis]
MKFRGTLIVAALLAGPAQAEVVESGPQGFTSQSSALLSKPPAEVWARLVEWPRWWDPAHSYSGNAASLSLDPRAGGLLIETWDGGSVRHAVVVAAMPGTMLRMSGGFGPLQALPMDAILDFSLQPEGQGTRLTMRYRVGGPPQSGLDKLAAPVDAVMSAGFQRLSRFVETGKAP